MRSASTVLLRTQSDARLVALARAGHDRAFEAIVERYRRPLLRACRRILPEARAEDALQQALVAAWTALRRGDEVSELRPWLYKVVRDTALNQLRVAGYDLDELVDTLAAAEDPQEAVERRALVRQTLAAVAALPERQRDALLRTAIEGRDQDEVARDLGLTNTALRQLVHRARVSVRAAATALIPLPTATWLAAAAPRAEPMTARIVELVAGSGAAGVTLAKAGTLAVLAGGAVSTPALVERPPAERPVRQAEAAEAPAAVVAEPIRRRRCRRPGPQPSRPAGSEDERADGDRGRDHRDDDDRGRRGDDRDDDDRDGGRGDRRDRDGDDDERDRDDDRADRRDPESSGDDDMANRPATTSMTNRPGQRPCESSRDDDRDESSRDGSSGDDRRADSFGGGSSDDSSGGDDPHGSRDDDER